MNTKQVLVWRHDLKVRKGKFAAMMAHASMSFLTKNGNVFRPTMYNPEAEFAVDVRMDHSEEVEHWLKNSFRKIVCYVRNEEELEALHQLALDKGLVSHMIIDIGATEFHGIPTKTCLAIGPAWDCKFNGITDHLPLL